MGNGGGDLGCHDFGIGGAEQRWHLVVQALVDVGKRLAERTVDYSLGEGFDHSLGEAHAEESNEAVDQRAW